MALGITIWNFGRRLQCRFRCGFEDKRRHAHEFRLGLGMSKGMDSGMGIRMGIGMDSSTFLGTGRGMGMDASKGVAMGVDSGIGLGVGKDTGMGLDNGDVVFEAGGKVMISLSGS